MTRLSVNINKVATLRNARGGNVPDLLQAALDIEQFGAEGITVHPRPDERHIRYSDVRCLHKALRVEFNIEGYPEAKFIDLVKEASPAQVTLVPDAPDALTSNAGWDVLKHAGFLKEVIADFKRVGIRTSLFTETDLEQIEKAAEIGADRVELYTEPYAKQYPENPGMAVEAFVKAGKAAKSFGLGLNAGHDLDLDNLAFFIRHLPFTDEVSIGHALISDALYFGLHNTVQMYLKEIAQGMRLSGQ